VKSANIGVKCVTFVSETFTRYGSNITNVFSCTLDVLLLVTYLLTTYIHTYLFTYLLTKNQSFSNNIGKSRPIQTKYVYIYIYMHAMGRQPSRNFGHDRPIGGKNGRLGIL